MTGRPSLIEEKKWGIPISIVSNYIEMYTKMSQFSKQPIWLPNVEN